MYGVVYKTFRVIIVCFQFQQFCSILSLPVGHGRFFIFQLNNQVYFSSRSVKKEDDYRTFCTTQTGKVFFRTNKENYYRRFCRTQTGKVSISVAYIKKSIV